MALKNTEKTESWEALLKGMGSLEAQVNEAVNFELGVIFIAIPKTGTTTVRSQTQSQGNFLVPGPHLNILQVRDSLYTYLLNLYRNRNNRFPTANLLSDSDIRKLTVKVYKELFKFSAVRNPWARAASLYARREGVQVSKNMTFEAFIQQHVKHLTPVTGQPFIEISTIGCAMNRASWSWILSTRSKSSILRVRSLKNAPTAESS